MQSGALRIGPLCLRCLEPAGGRCEGMLMNVNVQM